MTRWRERLLGTTQRLGWWTLPVFLAVGLIGAVLAGTLSVIYYSQQVQSLRDETRAARTEADEARDEIRGATEDALEQIEEQVDAVRQSLTTELPVEDPRQAGVVVVRAFPGPPPQPSPSPTASPQAQSSPQAQPSPEPQPSPTPRGDPALGSGFAVVRDGPTTFFVTAFAVVEDPREPGRIASDIEVLTGSATVSAGVRTFDRSLDVVLLEAEVGEIPVATWRPQDQAVAPGDKLWAVGLTPTFSTVQVGTTVAAVETRAILTDVSVLDPLRGGPLVDVDGRVVGVGTAAYQPYGGEGPGHAAVPIRALCEQLLRCGDQAADGDQPTDDPEE